jgi:GTP cyclohydrolase FolE2
MSTPLPVNVSNMPDIAGRPHTQPQGTLDWVGMSDIHQPILVGDGQNLMFCEDADRKLQTALNEDQRFVGLSSSHFRPLKSLALRFSKHYSNRRAFPGTTVY